MQRLEVSGAVRLIYRSLGVKPLILYKAKVAVCSEIHTKTDCNHHVVLLDVKPGGG